MSATWVNSPNLAGSYKTCGRGSGNERHTHTSSWWHRQQLLLPPYDRRVLSVDYAAKYYTTASH
eukprot:1186707-Prorocentrum_minimum.AAC.3